MNLSLITLLILTLGPVLLIASLLVKSMPLRVIFLTGGTAVMIWLTTIFSSIPGLYEQDHRSVENKYHREIMGEIDRLLSEGQTEEAKQLTRLYMEETEDASFMRNPLHEIVRSIRLEAAESDGVVDSEVAVPNENT